MSTSPRLSHALPSCPAALEENWRKTDPAMFFLPESEVLNVAGKPYLELNGQHSLVGAWKVKRFTSSVEDIKKALLANEFTQSYANALTDEMAENTIFVKVGHGTADVFEAEQVKTPLAMSSVKSSPASVIQNSPIGDALAARLEASCPHALHFDFSKKGLSSNVNVVIVNHSEPDFAQTYSSLYLKFGAGVEANLTIVEGGAAFGMHRHHVILNDGAKVEATWLHRGTEKTQGGHLLAERIVELHAGAQWTDAQFFAPKGTVRVLSNIIPKGPKAFSNSAATVVASGQSWLDYEPVQQHVASQAKTNLHLYMILAERARALFQGLIVVERDAADSQALQENRNLVLSGRARIDASPRLQISPKEVMCKHGSATGEIDPQQLYYLMTRGISETAARTMILGAFAHQGFANLNEESPALAMVESHLQNLLQNMSV